MGGGGGQRIFGPTLGRTRASGAVFGVSGIPPPAPFSGPPDPIPKAQSFVAQIWARDDGDLFTAIEPDKSINEFCLVKSKAALMAPYESPSSGLILMALEVPTVRPYFIPEMGPAPVWASYLQVSPPLLRLSRPSGCGMASQLDPLSPIAQWQSTQLEPSSNPAPLSLRRSYDRVGERATQLRLAASRTPASCTCAPPD